MMITITICRSELEQNKEHDHTMCPIESEHIFETSLDNLIFQDQLYQVDGGESNEPMKDALSKLSQLQVYMRLSDNLLLITFLTFMTYSDFYSDFSSLLTSTLIHKDTSICPKEKQFLKINLRNTY